MIWIFLVVAVVGFLVWKFNKDSQQVKRRNLAQGGMKSMYPDFVQYFEEEGYDFVEDSGSKLLYKKQLTNNPYSNKFLFLGLESKFSNVAFGYVITETGKMEYGLNVELPRNLRIEDIEMYYRKILGDMTMRSML